MFEIGFLCPKNVNEIKKEDLVQKQPVLKLKEIDYKQVILKMGSLLFFSFSVLFLRGSLY